ncbi:molybdopterin converting factor subunit 1 [Marinimicrobium sp. ABcell2]|uniref:molybdopterin converting factor subunit 1 n=1 Tax=Marinimicrobium sp. ABcell2 TaxID=3069751 RepID=UPI0027B59D97|nr:molybdopterin converting factor subunit 1 [Marinimicrobium sp. ABcell2]MDQ2077151.1 molybdopterin converting factor subunit 1 [Marinimicrobium sp. ABcell2]
MITVLFFAQLRDQLGCESVSVNAEGIRNLAELRAHLLEEHPDWQPYLGLESLLLAVNQTLVKLDHVVNSGDEVAFMPPVTGG